MIGEVTKNYPEPVREVVDAVVGILEKSGLLTETDPANLESILCEAGLKKFFSGEEIMWTDSEVFEALVVSEIQTQIDHLKELGLLDSIEDENGHEVLWPTDKGKCVLSEIAKNSSDAN